MAALLPLLRRLVGLLSTLILAVVVIFSTLPVAALSTDDNNALNLDTVWSKTYDPSLGCTSSTSAGSSTATSTFSPDPQAVDQYNKNLKPLIDPLVPLYQKAAAANGLADWQVLPAIHNLEDGLQRDNPLGNTSFRTPFEMSVSGLSSHGLKMDDPIFTPGHHLTDDEFVTVAGYAIQYYLGSNARYLKVDISKPLSPMDAAKIIISYKSGPGSVWLTGKADPNLHAYAWAGFDTTPEHKLPMAWGPGSPYGDEVAGTKINRPGGVTLTFILKGGNYAGTCAAAAGGGGTLVPVTGSKDELIQKILGDGNIAWGNYGSATSQKSDVQNCLTLKTLQGFVALADQSGVKILVNALATDHGGCTGSGSLHNRGRAIDIGYYGNGQPQHNADGDKLFEFVYNNWQALGISELIWQEPPPGFKCVGINGPVDCYAYYGTATMNDHYHHIHVGFNE